MCSNPSWHQYIFDSVHDPENYVCPVCGVNIGKAKEEA